MITLPELPITITAEQRANRYVAPRLAAEAFRAAGYDLTPDTPDPIGHAIDLGLVRLTQERDQPDRT